MREILFRGKCIESGEWVYGYYVHLTDHKGKESHRIYSGNSESDCGDLYPEWFEVNPATVGQYTGLQDVDCGWIFEGDIIESLNKLFPVKYGRCGAVQNMEHEGGYVGFYLDACGNDAEKISSCGMRPDIFYWFDSLEIDIVGNIHDNPELLKGAK